MKDGKTKPATAQDIESRVRALGAAFDLDVLAATRAIYRPHIDLPAAREQLDVPFGLHLRHRLDVYLPPHEPAAIVLFVHGGGFTGGDKNDDGVFYANVGRFLARAGFAAILTNYRRAPEFSWPSGAHDVRDAVAWIRDNGPPAGQKLPLFVWGQSAGASHVATWLFDDETRGRELGPVAGVLLMSGYYHPETPMAPGTQAYFGTEAVQYPRRSSVVQAKATPVPLWLSVAELDPGVMAARTFELAQRLCHLNRRAPAFAWLGGHNHVSTVLSLGSLHVDAGDAVLGFLRSHLAGTDR